MTICDCNLLHLSLHKARHISIMQTAADIQAIAAPDIKKTKNKVRDYFKAIGAILPARVLRETVNLGDLPRDTVQGIKEITRQFIRSEMRAVYERSIQDQGNRFFKKIQRSKKAIEFDEKRLAFSMANDRVKNYIENIMADLAKNLNKKQYANVRRILATASEKDYSPATIQALLYDTINLTDMESQWVANRFDRLIDAGYTDKQARDLADKYAEKLQRIRAERIARTEITRAYNYSNNEAVKQAVEEGEILRAWKVWRTSQDDRVRDLHEPMEGQRVGIDESFTLPDGSRTEYPDDFNERCTIEYVME